MNNVTNIASPTPRSDDDFPGGGYLDDAALITVLDREPDTDKRRRAPVVIGARTG